MELPRGVFNFNNKEIIYDNIQNFIKTLNNILNTPFQIFRVIYYY